MLMCKFDFVEYIGKLSNFRDEYLRPMTTRGCYNHALWLWRVRHSPEFTLNTLRHLKLPLKSWIIDDLEPF